MQSGDNCIVMSARTDVWSASGFARPSARGPSGSWSSGIDLDTSVFDH